VRIRYFLSGVSLLFLCGCAAKLTFIDRLDGSIHLGSSGSTAGNAGEATATIGNASYAGPWVYSRSGGGYSLGSAFGTATVVGQGGAATLTGSGSSTSMLVSAQGNGLINMRSKDGAFIRCVFSFNSMSSTGLGQCVRNDGREFDLTISR
jgi:hypothetical protein